MKCPAEGDRTKKPLQAKTLKRESPDGGTHQYNMDNTDSTISTTASLRRSDSPRRWQEKITELDLVSFIRDHMDVAVAVKSAEKGKKVLPFNYGQFFNASGKAPALENLLAKVNGVFKTQKTMVRVRAPLNVVGDIHGQFLDLHRVLTIGGWPSRNRYLFLGDYVDRGSQSLECIFLLFALFLRYENRIVLLRGNHECQHVNSIYGFLDECQRRLSSSLFTQFQHVFDNMPLAAIINRSILCMHGGISPEIKSLRDIDRIERPTAASDAAGITADLLWSDPDFDQPNWKEGCRGTGCLFGTKALTDFLKTHKLELIIRAHQVVQEGYQFFGDNRLITIFTAPNYCNEFANQGAFLSVSKDLKVQVHVLKCESKAKPGKSMKFPNFAN